MQIVTQLCGTFVNIYSAMLISVNQASDGDSSEGSIEMIGMEDSERDSVPLFNESAQSNTTSAEAVELEELMKKAGKGYFLL